MVFPQAWYPIYFWQGPRRLVLSAPDAPGRPETLLRAFYGGLSHRVWARYRRQAWALPGHPGRRLLALLERRLDVVVMRSHWYPSLAAARQAIAHGRILVNHRRITRPSYPLRPGDVLQGPQAMVPWRGARAPQGPGAGTSSGLSWRGLRALVKMLGKKAFRRSFLRGFRNPWVSSEARAPLLYTMTAYARPLPGAGAWSAGASLLHGGARRWCPQASMAQAGRAQAAWRRVPGQLEYAPGVATGIFVGTPQVVWYPFLIDLDAL
jgi:hypothetical protein